MNFRHTSGNAHNIVDQQRRSDIDTVINHLAAVAEEVYLSTHIHLLQSFTYVGKDSFTALTGFRFAEYIDTHGDILSLNMTFFVNYIILKKKGKRKMLALTVTILEVGLNPAADCYHK